MGLLRRKKQERKVQFLMPNGDKPQFESSEDLNKLFEDWTYRPEKKESWPLHKTDQDVWIESSARLTWLGLHESGENRGIVATGNVYLSGLKGQRHEMRGRAFTTENFTVVDWTYGLRKHFLVLHHDSILTIKTFGPGTNYADFGFSDATWIKGSSKMRTGPIDVYIACRFGKDWQMNRRTISFWYSFANLLKIRFEE